MWNSTTFSFDGGGERCTVWTSAHLEVAVRGLQLAGISSSFSSSFSFYPAGKGKGSSVMAMMPSIKGRYQAGYPQAFLYGGVKPAYTYKATCRARARSANRQSGGVVCASSPSRYCGGDGTLDHQQMRGSSSLGAAAEPRVNPTAAVASQALAARSPLASVGSAMASAEIAAWASASAVAVGSWAVWLVVESGVVSVAQKRRRCHGRSQAPARGSPALRAIWRGG